MNRPVLELTDSILVKFESCCQGTYQRQCSRPVHHRVCMTYCVCQTLRLTKLPPCSCFVQAAEWEQAATKATSSTHKLGALPTAQSPVLQCKLLCPATRPYSRQAWPTIQAEICCLSCFMRHAHSHLQAVKAAGSIHNVSRRLLPNGLYFDSERTTMEELHGDQLSIENLCETSWSHPNSKWRPAHLKLCPLPLPDGMEEPSDMRLRQVSPSSCLC